MSNDAYYMQKLGICPAPDGVHFEIEGKEGRYTVYDALAHIMITLFNERPDTSQQYRMSSIGMHDFYVPSVSKEEELRRLKKDYEKLFDAYKRNEAALKLYATPYQWRRITENGKHTYVAKESLSGIGYSEAQKALDYSKRILNEGTINNNQETTF